MMAAILPDQTRKEWDLRPRFSGRRLWPLRLLTIAVALGISLVVIEVVVRVYRLHNPIQPVASAGGMTEVYEFWPSRHHQLVPNVEYRHRELEFDYLWVNNSLGMRDRERSMGKGDGSFRILFMGDSMVQGYGVPQEQTMVALLETSLNEPRRVKQIEVLNGGVFGYGALLQYLYLKEIVPLVEPDLVVVGFFLGNDVGDDYFYSQQATRNDNGDVSFAKLSWPWAYKEELLKNKTVSAQNDSKNYDHTLMLKSQLIRLFLKAYERRRSYEQSHDYRRREEQLIRERRDDIRVNLGAINYPVTDQRRRLHYWEISKSYLKYMHGLCQRTGVPMILAVIPVLEPGSGVFNEFEEPAKILKELGKELSMPIVFLVKEFGKWPAKDLHFELDGHWNALGNRVAAGALDKELRSLNLLPGLLVN